MAGALQLKNFIAFKFEFIGVLRHMQWYFSHIYDGTDVQADWRSCTYGRAPNAMDISQGSLKYPSRLSTLPWWKSRKKVGGSDMK